MHPKSAVIADMAQKSGVKLINIPLSENGDLTGVPTMHPITKQILGHELKEENSTKVEYHVKSQRGRIVANFDKLETAEKFIRNQKACHGEQAPTLNLFQVTTITEKL